MLLAEKLYQLKQLSFENDVLIGEIRLNKEDPIFKGHFPGNPITPGVAQLEIIKELLSHHFEREIHLKSISNCKYLAILNPVENDTFFVKISITNTEIENELKISATIYFNEIVFTKLSGVYY